MTIDHPILLICLLLCNRGEVFVANAKCYQISMGALSAGGYQLIGQSD